MYSLQPSGFLWEKCASPPPSLLRSEEPCILRLQAFQKTVAHHDSQKNYEQFYFFGSEMTVYVFKPLFLLRLNPGSELFLGRHYLGYLYFP